MRLLAAAGFAAFALSLSGCSPSEPAADSAETAALAVITGPLTILDGVVYIPAGDRDVTAGFGTLAAGDRAISVLHGEASFASAVELHTHSMDESGRMAMRQVESFDIPANGAHELRRGGDHMMFFGIDREALLEGESVEVTLHGRYEDGTEESVVVTLTVSEL